MPETVAKLTFRRQSVFLLRRTRTSESSHAETFSLSKYPNRGTRPRFGCVCAANALSCALPRGCRSCMNFIDKLKGTPTACLFRALRAQSPAAFCLRQNRQDRRSAERRIKFPVKVQLCRTFTPVPAPRRRGLVRRTPGHLLLPFQGNSPCADERGVSFPVSPEPETYPRGTASPLEVLLA